MPSDYPNVDPVKFPELAKYNNKQGSYVGYGVRESFQRNQDRIYAAGENQNANEYGESLQDTYFYNT